MEFIVIKMNTEQAGGINFKICFKKSATLYYLIKFAPAIK